MALTATLVRQQSTDQGTKGTITLRNGNYEIEMKTLELPWKNNQSQYSCIPKGTYKCSIVNSPKFGRVYNVKDVPNRTAILIHRGNTAGDKNKGYKSDVLGCILLGLTHSNNGTQTIVANSRPAVAAFQNFFDNQPFEITIK